MIEQTDFEVGGGGSVYTITPMNEAAEEHLRSHVGDDAMWMGPSLAVEHRYARDLAQQLINDGFTVS